MTKLYPMLALLAGLSMALATSASFAQSRAIKFIVPLSLGGPNDLVARLTAEHIQQNKGVSMVIENRAGAGTSSAPKSWRGPFRTESNIKTEKFLDRNSTALNGPSKRPQDHYLLGEGIIAHRDKIPLSVRPIRPIRSIIMSSAADCVLQNDDALSGHYHSNSP